MRTSADTAAAAAEQIQDRTYDREDYSDSPQQRNTQNEAEEHEYKSENNHGLKVPAAVDT